ncbi:MAG: hypothetical protein L6R39_002628 [Caloplaca ligustica]|nr:MAG: hypothetical protein L6R39_002628 [Caloplaca ligustica]
MAWDPTGFDYSFTQSSKPEPATHHGQAPWTAARCQRLLRPLSAKLALLRKEKQSFTAVIEDFRQGHSGVKNSGSHRPSLSFGERRRRSDKVNLADEEWAPNPRASKRIKRTYTLKTSSSQQRDEPSHPSATDQPSQDQSEITIPSDFLQGKPQFGPEPDAAASSGDPSSIRKDWCISKREIRDSKKVVAGQSRSVCGSTIPSAWKLTSGIYKGLEALLGATERHGASQNGVRSLFATCLRKVPDFIAQEELWHKTEDPESDIDISSVVYRDLEARSTSEANGWKPLREVVRAHGISMVGSAVSEGLIENNPFRGIINLCLRLGAYDEAQHLLECSIVSMGAFEKRSNIRSCLIILEDFVTATGRHSFRYKTLSRLLRSRLLSPDWISRPETVDVWNKVVRSISHQDKHAASATELLRLAVTMTYGSSCHDPAELVHGVRLRRSGLLKQANEHFVDLGYETNWPRGSLTAAVDGEREALSEKTSATISSLMTVLCAISLLRSAATVSGSSPPYVPNMSALRDAAADAEQILELGSERIFTVRKVFVAVPLLAAGLVKATLCHSRHEFANTVPNVFDTLWSLDHDTSIVEDCSFFLTAVAECCARGMSEDTFQHIQKIVQHIHHVAKSLKPLSTSYELCNRIGVAAALEYAESTKHPKHLHWALDVEQAITGAHLESARRTPAKTPLRGETQTRNGYRWEAGICEWVAKTPAIALRKPQMREQAASLADPMDCRCRSDSKRSTSSSLRSSSCSSSGPRKTTCDRMGSQGKRRLRSPRPGEPAKVETSKARSMDDVFCSHIFVEDEGDELSMFESFQEAQAQGACGLKAVMNVATKMNQRPNAWKRRGVKCKSLGLEQTDRWKVRRQEQDTALDSEDELSFL